MIHNCGAIKPCRRREKTGFSLLELLVTVALVAMLALVAVPSFAAFMEKSEVKVTAHRLMHSLNLARTIAITEHQMVHVCQLESSDELVCGKSRRSNRSWSAGWIVFIDINSNNELEDQDQIVSIVQLENSIKSKVLFNQNGRLRFFPNGRARSAGFYICNSNGKFGKHILLLHSGRARMRDSLSAKQQEKCSVSEL